MTRFPFERYVQGKPSVRAEELRYFQPSEIDDACQEKKIPAQAAVEFRERRLILAVGVCLSVRFNHDRQYRRTK